MRFETLMAKGLVASSMFTTMPTISFANEINNNIIKTDFKNSSLEETIKNTPVNTWIRNITNLPVEFDYYQAEVINGKMYVVGRYYDENRNVVNALYEYNLSSNSWTKKADVPIPENETFYGFSSVVLDNKLYVLGGMMSGSLPNGNFLRYDPESNQWEKLSHCEFFEGNFSMLEVVNGKIYVFGGGSSMSASNSVAVYNPQDDTWVAKQNMPDTNLSTSYDEEGLHSALSAVIGDKVYIIGGHNDYGWSINNISNKVFVYDTVNDIWESKTDAPKYFGSCEGYAINGKIYIVKGNYQSALDESSKRLPNVIVYDPATETWEAKAEIPTNQNSLSKIAIMDGNIFVSDGQSIDVYIAQKEMTDEEKATVSVDEAEITKDIESIKNARMLVNALPESSIKDQLQTRLNNINASVELDRKIVTSNVDVYIKSENMLKLTLDTNSITFEDFSGVDDIEKSNAVNLTVSSSLPYKVDAYLATEIQNATKDKTMNKDILKIKANEKDESEYVSFTDINTTPITLLDDQVAGNDIVHGVDLKLQGGLAFDKDIYKTTIKFEVAQK